MARKASWIRGRLDQTLPPDATRVLPEMDRVRLRSSVERPGAWTVFPSSEATHGDDWQLEIAVSYVNGSPIQDLYIDVLQENAPDPNPLWTDADGMCGLSSGVVSEGTHTISISHQHLPNITFEVQVAQSPIRAEFVLTPGIQPGLAFANATKLG
jgi:hypothetical protein